MAQPHAYWQHQFLHTAGLPTSDENIQFLDDWKLDRNSGVCDHNFLDLSKREPGSTPCTRLPNGRRARNYVSTASAANAFADQLNLSDYPALRRALATGKPYSYKDKNAVALNLQKWGSTEFQSYYLKQEGIAQGGGGSKRVPRSKNVGGAWSNLMRVLARDGHRTIVELRKATADLSRIERRLRRA